MKGRDNMFRPFLVYLQDMARIGIMDSGVGGLSVFREIYRLLPSEDYIYFSDNACCPYGEKSPEFIRERCHEIVDMMLSKGVQAVVIACNTATSAAIADLRQSYDIPFVGMEPAVKPAVHETKTGVVGVLATKGTLTGSKYLGIKEQYGSGVKMTENIGQGFVELVENGQLDGPETESVVRTSLQPLLDSGADVIVLGCTHYPFLLPVLERIAGPSVRFIDPSVAVARHLGDILVKNGIPTGEGSGTREFIASGDPGVLNRMKW